MNLELLCPEIISDELENLNHVKNFIICAANGETEQFDPRSSEALLFLHHLELKLRNLKDNLSHLHYDVNQL